MDFSKLLGLPLLASERGKDVDALIIYVHLLMGALFVIWLGFFVYVLFKFNAKRHPQASYTGVKSHVSTYLEGGVALVEALLLIAFAIPFWAKVVDKMPAPEKSTVVRMIAQQFQWNARYAGVDGVFGKQDRKLVNDKNNLGLDKSDPKGKDDFISINEMYVPVNKDVIVNLTSLDVIHCFKVLPLRVTQDAMPGMMIPVHFKPTVEGHFQIMCAQLCGNSHAIMKGFLNVVKQPEYDDWVKKRSATGGGGAASFD